MHTCRIRSDCAVYSLKSNTSVSDKPQLHDKLAADHWIHEELSTACKMNDEYSSDEHTAMHGKRRSTIMGDGLQCSIGRMCAFRVDLILVKVLTLSRKV